VEVATQTSSALVRADPGFAAFTSRSLDGIWHVEFAWPIPVDLPVRAQVERALRTGRVREANDAAASMLGRRQGMELAGLGLPSLLGGGESRVRELLEDLIAGDYRLHDRVLPTGNGAGAQAIVCSLTGIVQQGVLVGVWAIQRRAHERQSEAEQFHRVQRMAAIGQLAGSVAHDFNNLLTAILGYGEMVRDELEPGSRCLSDMEQVLSAGRRAETLTRQLLTFSRRQKCQCEVFDINTAVRELEPLIRRLVPDDVALVLACAPGTLLVRGDRGQLELVIMNLAVNARDAMPHGGRITIATHAGSAAAGSESARLTVSDTGTGISPDVLPRIFEPFFTTKSNGTGLGLATAQEIVSRSGGRLEVESAAGRGTTFTVVFGAPAVDPVTGERIEPRCSGPCGAAHAGW
jgi:signal transduction histidine kinase